MNKCLLFAVHAVVIAVHTVASIAAIPYFVLDKLDQELDRVWLRMKAGNCGSI